MPARLALALAAAHPPVSIAEAEARLAELDARRAVQEAAVTAAQAPLARLLATVERLALRPGALAFARPGAVDDLIHARALLIALRPAIARRAATLARESADLRAQGDAEAQALAALAGARSASQNRLADRLARIPAPLPVAAPAAPTGAYRLPATGRVIAGTGESALPGGRARGLTLATAAGISVAAPAAARVAYAGPFGGYGDIVILDHGHGWTTLLAGLDRAFVGADGRVGQGEAIGRMGRGTPRLTIELRHRGRPVDVAGMAAQ